MKALVELEDALIRRLLSSYWLSGFLASLALLLLLQLISLFGLMSCFSGQPLF